MRKFLFRQPKRTSTEKTQLVVESIPSLMSTGKWGEVCNLLTNPSILEYISTHQDKNDSKGYFRTLIYTACASRPTLPAIQLLCRACPRGLCTADKRGRRALHLAVRYGANPFVIEYLLRMNPSAAHQSDYVGKTCLILATKYYLSTYHPSKEGYYAVPKRSAMNKVVELLCEAAPQVVNQEDNEGMSALEYAIGSNTPLSTVQTIQMTSYRMWNASRGENDKEDETKSIPENNILRNHDARSCTGTLKMKGEIDCFFFHPQRKSKPACVRFASMTA